MGRATIQDAFNAASHYAQQGLGYLTKEKEYELDTILFEQSIELEKFQKELIADYTRVDPETGENPFQQNPEAYRRHVNERMAEWRRTANSAGGHSRYYQDKLNRMDAQGSEIMRQRTAAVTDDVARQRVDIAYAKADTEIDNAGLGIQETLAAKMVNLNMRESQNAANPIDVHKEMTRFANEGLSQALNIDIGNKTIKEAFNEIDANVATLGEAFSQYLSEGETLDSFLEDRRERIEAAKETARKAIQERQFDSFRVRDAEIERYVISGNLNEAIRLSRIYGAELNRYYNPNNPEYENFNNDHRDRASGYFDVSRLEAYQRQGTRGESMALLDYYGPEMFIRPQINGDGTVIVGRNGDGRPITVRYDSISEAMEGFMFYKREAFFASKGGEDTHTLQLWEAEQAEWFEKFHNEVGTALNQINPTLSSDFSKFRNFDTYITDKRGNEYYNRGVDRMTPEQRDEYGQRCVDFFHSIFYNGITDVPTIRQMMREFTGREIENVLQWRSTPSDQGRRYQQLKAFSEKAMSGQAEDILFVRYNPERLDLEGRAPEQTFVFRNEAQRQAVEMVREEERSIAAGILGTDKSNLMSSWMNSERRRGDVIPKGVFKIEEGENAGTYRLNYDNNANPVLMRQNPQTGAWVEHTRSERPPTEPEARRQADVRNSVNNIKNQENPEMRRTLSQELLRRNEGDQGGIQRIENELWKEGINAYTGDVYEVKTDGLYMNGNRISEMPAPMWDAMLQGMNPDQQRVQRETWRALGISRSTR